MHPTTAPNDPVSLPNPADRLVLLSGGEPERASHPASHGRLPAAAVPSGHMDASLLLLIREEENHGYELAARLVDFGFADADMGTLYRRLRRLERDGLVASWWDAAPSGPPRRRYTLTATGATWLAAYAGSATRVRGTLSAFLQRYRASRPG